jgi:uncharacterized tellurite resistance protein B-like protein
MQTAERTLLKDYSDEEKGAYLGAIASLATADHAASAEELEHLGAMADAADISADQRSAVLRAASELSDEELKRCLEILRHSDLRYSLVTDLISFAESDQNYSETEKKTIEQVAKHLDVNKEQFSLLDQFVQKTKEADVKPEDVEKPGFLASLGLQDRFQQSGLNWKRIMPGLLGVAGPLLMSSLLRRRGAGGGMSSMLNPMMNRGGIGSLISGLSGGRGLGNIGSLLSGLLGRR